MLTYPMVGATRELTEVPDGFRPLERRAVIGSGQADFERARENVLRWGVQRGSGMSIDPAVTRPIGVGDRVRLSIPFGPLRVIAPAEVVYVVDEPRQAGFAYGTLRGHPERGEEAFLVGLNPDGTVELVIRAFSRPASWFWWLGAPILRLTQEFYTRRYLRALAP